MKHCDEVDCLLHPNNSQNYTIDNYSARTDSRGNLVVGLENNTLQIGDVAFSTNNTISELVLNIKNYNIKIPIECLFCEKRNKMNMKNEILKKKAKSLLED